jgi:ABC-type sugar transport system ATPase subunit
MELADRINVLRQGANAEHFKPSDVSLQDIIDLMPK